MSRSSLPSSRTATCFLAEDGLGLRAEVVWVDENMFIYGCTKVSCGWVEAREEPWGPDRCPECGNWRVEVQQERDEELDTLMDDPCEFDSELD